MKTKEQYYKFIIAVIFIWIGFIGAISFMEAWLKFQAPGITTELGLGIGKLIFNALNNVEIACIALIIAPLVFSKITRRTLISIYFFIPLTIVLIQTLWLLPALGFRADQIIKGVEMPKSRLHLWYVALESIKLIALLIYGIKLLKKKYD